MRIIGLIVFVFWMTERVFAGDPLLISSEGSGRATGYLESPKIVTFQGKTHIAWLDSPAEGFRVRIRTLDHETGQLSEAYTIGESEDNHGGPALVVDGEGFLHVVYFSHHHPFRYSRSARPNDASEWTPYVEFGKDLTYPTLLCDEQGGLILTARRSYESQPWELEMWRKAPGKAWRRDQTILRTRFVEYAQFSATMAWGADHKTLHLGTRIYERPTDEAEWPFTTVGYLRSLDGGDTWERSDGSPVELPVTPETIDRIASGRGREGRILNAGSIAVGPDGVPFVPYSVRIEDSSQSYLATPYGDQKWRHLNLNTSLPEGFRDWDILMHGGISFGSSGQPIVVGVMMQVASDAIEWGEPSSEIVVFRSRDGGRSFFGEALNRPSADLPRWLPNLERPTGFNEMSAYPSFLYTEGGRGSGLQEKLSNNVFWISVQPY